MLKDSLPSYQPPHMNDLHIGHNFEVNEILGFIDNNISSFYLYYQNNKDSVLENWISNLLVLHLQLCNIERGGFLPYIFSKNPPQSLSAKETDIGVYVNTRCAKPLPIIEFEAKRFSEASNNKEYVCGERGGIERFKRGHHSSHLSVCGMFGYVQSRTTQEWVAKVNDWIDELSRNDTDQTIDWTDKAELLVGSNSFPKVEKLSSRHSRKYSKDNIVLWHYMIELN
ncbi:MAG: hypothetical protein IPH88_14910 [Bacteroidales bacterium]|nr:hypothetical protein [Bacteroidales bacterium]